MPELTPDERRRYGRHVVIPEVGEAGQLRLKTGSVLVVGAGGLGSPALLYLAAAGVGRIGIVEFDNVDESNLQRQVIYGTGDIGKPKIEAAQARLADVNPHVQVEPHAVRLDATNVIDLISRYDVVIDGTDNFAARYLVNDACVLTGRPNVYGSVFRFEGQVSVFATKEGPCYRCLHPEPPPPGVIPGCSEAGVLGVLPGLVGTIQANEALKIIGGFGDPLIGRLLLIDALGPRFREIRLPKDPGCPVCGDNPSITAPVEYTLLCGDLPVEEATEITAAELRARIVAAGAAEPLLILDVREPGEHAIDAIEGSRLIPLGELASRLGEIPRDRAIAAYCAAGMRSAKAAKLLRDKGFQAVSLKGGMAAWRGR
ncbi:MAG: molybdopterin-synthase adenylyltransferase MoeB [Acidobacteria bacterium]|nr:molybdopterin-synthase adenylyltransferase MoeB [Acidobacteriota bacterium]